MGESKIKIWITKQLRDIGYLIKELLTLIGSIIIFIPLGVIGVLYSIVKHLCKMDFSLRKLLNPVIRGVTLAIDGFGNSTGGEMMNDFLKPSVKFGNWYQTISAVVGINFLSKKELPKFRNTLNKILGKKHCEDAITEVDRFFYGIKTDEKRNR